MGVKGTSACRDAYSCGSNCASELSGFVRLAKIALLVFATASIHRERRGRAAAGATCSAIVTRGSATWRAQLLLCRSLDRQL
jgi:hypothetical protein